MGAADLAVQTAVLSKSYDVSADQEHLGDAVVMTHIW